MNVISSFYIDKHLQDYSSCKMNYVFVSGSFPIRNNPQGIMALGFPHPKMVYPLKNNSIEMNT